jgi:hypothetical protein
MKLSVFCALALNFGLSGVAFAQGGAPATTPPESSPPAGGGTAGVVGADLAGGFGVLGQLVVSDDISFNLIHESAGSQSRWNIAIQPALDYFIAPNISVGGAIGIGHTSASVNGMGSADTTVIGIAAQGGYALRLTEMLSLWAKLSLGYTHVGYSFGSMSASGYVIPLRIFVPILFHPVQHFFIGVGPVLAFQLANKTESTSNPKETDIGLLSTIGGYWGR